MNISKFLGWIGSLLFTIRIIPQIYHTYKYNTVDGLSKEFIFLDFFSAIFLGIYSISIGAWPNIITNFSAIIFDLILFIIYLKVVNKQLGKLKKKIKKL